MARKTLMLGLAIVVLSAMTASAGTGYPMKCSNCGYAATVMIGGGMKFSQITGFCGEKKEFVCLTWEQGQKKPEPVARIWDSSTGKVIELYQCPDCSKPFMPLQLDKSKDGPGFDCCPKCGKKTFKVDPSKGIMMYD